MDSGWKIVKCVHDPFLTLSPIWPLLIPSVGFTPPTLFLGPTGYMDQFWPHPTGSLGLSLSHSNPWPKAQSEQASLASEMEWPSKIMWSSCDDVQPHVTHATSSAGHLAGGPGTEGPTLLSFNLFLYYSVLMHFWLLCSACMCTCSWSWLRGQL